MIEEQAQDFVFLADRSEQDWATLIAAMEREQFSAGEEVIRAGDTDRALFLLVAGTLEVLVGEAKDGALKAIAAPTVVGEIAFLDARPRSVTLRATTDGEILRLDYVDFEALAEREPELARAILFDLGRIVAARLRLATDFIVEQLEG